MIKLGIRKVADRGIAAAAAASIRLATTLVVALALRVEWALASEPRPCPLLTAAEIASAIGAAPEAGEPHGPTPDKELGATGWSCDRRVGKYYLSVTTIQFPSAPGATHGMTLIAQEAKAGPGGIRLSAVPGPGDQALWGASNDGALWVARKGNNVLSVTLAGDLADPERFREPLRRLLASALARMP